MQYILLGKHGSSEDCSAGVARREEKQDFSIHHFSQLLTKPPALQGPSGPELEAFRQPARAFAPSSGSLQGNLPDDSEQTVARAFLPHKGQIFLSAHLHQGLGRKQKLKDRRRPWKQQKRWNLGSPQSFAVDSFSVRISEDLALMWVKGKFPTWITLKDSTLRAGPTTTAPKAARTARHTHGALPLPESIEGLRAAHQGSAQESKSSATASCPNPAPLWLREYPSINSPTPFLTFSPGNCQHTLPAAF